MQKYLGNLIENKKVDGDCGKAESVQKLLNIYLKRADSETYEKYVKVQNCLSTPPMNMVLLMKEFCGTSCILTSYVS